MTDETTPTTSPILDGTQSMAAAQAKIKSFLSPKADEAEGTPGTEITTPPEGATAFGQPPEGEDSPAPEGAEAEAPVRYKVKVSDGNEIEVDVNELKRGYLRLSDYTRKTQKTAEDRKSVEAELAATREERSKYAKGLEDLRVHLAAVEEPDLQKLLNEDPIEFIRQDAVRRNRQERLQAVEREQRRLAEQQAAEQERALRAYIRDEQAKLLDRLPEWRDVTKQNRERADIIAYGRELGWSDEDLDKFYDHRALYVLRNSMLYEKSKLEAKKAVEKAGGPKIAAPGHLKPQVMDREHKAAMERFGKAPTTRNAAELLKARMAQHKR